MDVRNSLNKSYYNMTVGDIRMNNKTSGGNISYNSMMYLDIISYQESCTVSSLAETLGISKPAVTKKINELMKMELVIKTQSSKDKRVYYLKVSEKMALDNQVYDRPFEQAVRAIGAQYTKEQLDIFCEILETFSAEFVKGD